MTVNELIAQLITLPETDKTKTVMVEGCDCDGYAKSIAVDKICDIVYIKR